MEDSSICSDNGQVGEKSDSSPLLGDNCDLNMNQSDELVQNNESVHPEHSVGHGNSSSSVNLDIGTFLEFLKSYDVQGTSEVVESDQPITIVSNESKANLPNQEECDSLQPGDKETQDIAVHDNPNISENSSKLNRDVECSFNNQELENKSNDNPDLVERSGHVKNKISVVNIQKLIANNSSSDLRQEQKVDSGNPSRPIRIHSPIFIPVCKSESEVLSPNNQLCQDQLNTEYKEEPNAECDDYDEGQIQMEESELGNESNNLYGQYVDASQNASSQDSSNAANATIRYATGKSISYFDDQIPAGWKRVKTQRKNGQVALS